MPNAPGDFPPQAVVVKESGTASWSGQSGSANNDLEFPEVSGTSTGTKYHIKENPGLEFRVTRYPTANGVLWTPTPEGLMSAYASVSYSATANALDISLSGGYKNVGERYLIGQECRATVVSPLSITSRMWTVSGGSPFKDWIVSIYQPLLQSSATLVGLNANDLIQPELVFCFGMDGSSSISCTVHLDVPPGSKPEGGLDATLTRITPIEKPVVTHTAINGVVRLVSQTFVGLENPPEIPSSPRIGIRFFGSVSTPEQLHYGGEGAWNWVQLVTLNDTRVLSGQTQQYMCGNDEIGWYTSGLDTAYPFAPLELPGEVYPANGQVFIAKDPPGSDDLLSTPTSYMWDEKFTIYMMYKPRRPGSKFVPVAKNDWFWKAPLSKIGNQWALVGGSTNNSPTIQVLPHPTWNKLVFGPALRWR